MPRVFVRDPHYPLELVRRLLEGVATAEPEGAPDADVLGLLVGPDYPVVRDDFERLPALRVVATGSVGYDHIDLDEAGRRGIWVCNVPDYCIEEMADSAVALLLALVRGVVELDRSVRAGRWDYDAAGPLCRCRDLRLGVVGFGRIGRAVAERALALGMEVWATDPAVPADEIAALGVRPTAFDELLRGCNAVSLHVPLTPETQGLIGERELSLLPRGSYLVNTARGGLLDHDALLRALADGQLAGAALDTLPVEPPRETPPQAPGLVVNPHAAWYSAASEEAVFRRSTLSVRAAIAGGVPEGAVAGPPRA